MLLEDELLVSHVDFQTTKEASWWKPTLLLYFHRKDGLAKLQREKPSTGICGNWTILEALKFLQEETTSELLQVLPQSIKGSFLVGKKLKGCNIPIPISESDANEAIAKAWKQLWVAFTDKNSGTFRYCLK